MQIDVGSRRKELEQRVLAVSGTGANCFERLHIGCSVRFLEALQLRIDRRGRDGREQEKQGEQHFGNVQQCLIVSVLYG